MLPGAENEFGGLHSFYKANNFLLSFHRGLNGDCSVIKMLLTVDTDYLRLLVMEEYF